MNMMKTTKLKKVQFKKLVEFFETIDKNQNNMSLTKLHGFLTAIVSAPNLIMPSQWLPIIFGEENDETIFNSMEKAQEIIGLIMQIYNNICSELQNLDVENEDFSLLLWNHNDIVSLQSSSWELLSSWCDGYLLGTTLFNEHPKNDERAFMLLLPIGVLAEKFNLIGEKDENGNIIENDLPYKEKFKQNLPVCIAIHYLYWRNNQDADFVQKRGDHYSKKIGRNEPCLCGSGKKHKKCCGSPLRVVQ